MSEHLADQPTKKPTRKVRAGGYFVAALTVATYLVGAVQGDDGLVSAEAAGQALSVLAGGAGLLLTQWQTRNEA